MTAVLAQHSVAPKIPLLLLVGLHSLPCTTISIPSKIDSGAIGKLLEDILRVNEGFVVHVWLLPSNSGAHGPPEGVGLHQCLWTCLLTPNAMFYIAQLIIEHATA